MKKLLIAIFALGFSSSLLSVVSDEWTMFLGCMNERKFTPVITGIIDKQLVKKGKPALGVGAKTGIKMAVSVVLGMALEKYVNDKLNGKWSQMTPVRICTAMTTLPGIDTIKGLANNAMPGLGEMIDGALFGTCLAKIDLASAECAEAGMGIPGNPKPTYAEFVASKFATCQCGILMKSKAVQDKLGDKEWAKIGLFGMCSSQIKSAVEDAGKAAAAAKNTNPSLSLSGVVDAVVNKIPQGLANALGATVMANIKASMKTAIFTYGATCFMGAKKAADDAEKAGKLAKIAAPVEGKVSVTEASKGLTLAADIPEASVDKGAVEANIKVDEEIIEE